MTKLLKWLKFRNLHPDARGRSQGGHNSRQYGDDDVQYFTPKIFIHFWIMNYELLCIMYDV